MTIQGQIIGTLALTAGCLVGAWLSPRGTRRYETFVTLAVVGFGLAIGLALIA